MKRDTSAIHHPTSAIERQRRQRGAAAVLSMMFLVIFGSLAAAMAIVSQGNLHTADTHLKVNRSLAASETGLRLMIYRLALASEQVQTRSGTVWDPSLGTYITTLKESDLSGDASGMPVDVLMGKSDAIWDAVATILADEITGELHNEQEPYIDADGVLHVGPMAVGPNAPSFTATFAPHPLVGEDYDGEYYDRPPYSDMGVSSTSPLDGRFIRVTVEAYDGKAGDRVYRSVSMDFQMVKRIEYAVLSRSRVMIGKNVMIEGRIGSTFAETHLTNGHPLQIASDFRGLDPDLDAKLDALLGSIISDDQDGDNRLSIYNSTEVEDYTDPASYDTDNDGFITEFDFFLDHFDTSSSPGAITQSELETQLTPLDAAQLLALIDTFGSPSRAGYNDGVIDEYDRYAKVRGEVHIAADVASWEAGAASATGEYQDHLQGPIVPGHNETAMTFDSTETGDYELTPEQFDVSSFEAIATGDFASQAGSPSRYEREAVPFGASYPYDYYDRPVYEGITFDNVTIPKGTNALFIDCRFIGTTFVKSEVQNSDPDYNYAGMIDITGDQKHPDRFVTINGTDIYDTKTISNNIRFHNCKFEGAVITSVPEEYTHVRNKVTFTGNSGFEIEESTRLTDAEKLLYQRSSLLAPQYSIEMGTFIAPYDTTEVIQLSGTIVAGMIDMRGQVSIDGQLLTTFEPKSNTGPVIGDTSPQFNTTLGYFGAADGDLETELPENGFGLIHVRYNDDLPLPDGILGPIETVPMWSTYFEGGQKN